jgi:hypothetical protein
MYREQRTERSLQAIAFHIPTHTHTHTHTYVYMYSEIVTGILEEF